MSETANIEALLFETFKVQLILFVKQHFKPCDSFIRGLTETKTNAEIVTYFKHNNHDVFNRLGGNTREVSDLEDENETLTIEIDELNDEIRSLENKIEDYEDIIGSTLNDNYKYEHFVKYRNAYTEWELEELLKNGKKYLTK